MLESGGIFHNKKRSYDMRKIVNIYAMRHGRKNTESGPNDLTLLSAEGEKQVLTSAQNNFNGFSFDGLYCSKKFRTLQTVTLICSILPNRNCGMGIETRDGFDYSGAPDLHCFNDDEQRILAGCAKLGVSATIADWEMASPRMVNFLRSRLTNDLHDIAIKHAQMTNKDSSMILVGSHTVVAELACVDSSKMFPLREADIIRYSIEVIINQEEAFAEIISSDFIDRGF
jgi:hypothetical protein